MTDAPGRPLRNRVLQFLSGTPLPPCQIVPVNVIAQPHRCESSGEALSQGWKRWIAQHQSLVFVLAASGESDYAWVVEVLLKGILRGIVLAWPVWVVLGVIAVVRFAWGVHRWRRLGRSGIRDIDKMDGKTFERYLEVLFTRLGFHVERTRYAGDYGADLVVSRDGVKMVIQAKRSRRKIGIKAVQEVVAAKPQYGCDKAMVVTNAYYTRQAIKLAKSNKVTTWDRDRLVTALLSTKGATRKTEDQTSRDAALAFQQGNQLPEPSVVVASCAQCAKPVSAKVMEFCVSRADRFNGLVYCYEHQRGRR